MKKGAYSKITRATIFAKVHLAGGLLLLANAIFAPTARSQLDVALDPRTTISGSIFIEGENQPAVRIRVAVRAMTGGKSPVPTPIPVVGFRLRAPMRFVHHLCRGTRLRAAAKESRSGRSGVWRGTHTKESQSASSRRLHRVRARSKRARQGSQSV